MITVGYFILEIPWRVSASTIGRHACYALCSRCEAHTFIGVQVPPKLSAMVDYTERINPVTSPDAMLGNQQRFQLEHGSHLDKELQKDWDEFGSDAFTFEALDQLEPSNEPDYDVSEDLRVLMQMWFDKLRETDELLYEKSRKSV